MYIGIPPFGQTVRTVTEKVAVQDQVDFYPDGGYLPGYVDIEMNGQSLLSTDFFATDGVKITLVVACNVLDEFRSVAYWPVSMVDTYRKAEADARYLNLAGGTLTGGLTAAGNFLMTANSGNARVVGVSNGTNTTLVLQGGGNGAGALGGNIELGRDGNNMYDATVSRFRSLDGSTQYGQFDATGFSFANYLISGSVPLARLTASGVTALGGTASGSTFLRGDGNWASLGLGAAASLNLSVYDSGWYSVSRDTSYTKAHNLGGNNLLILNYFSYDAASVFTQTFPSFHSSSHSYTGGAVITNVDATNLVIRTGANDIIGYSPYPNTDTMRFGGVDHMTAGGQVSGYYRTFAIKIG